MSDIEEYDLDKEEIIEKAKKLAKKKFSKGYNCAEAVFETTIDIAENDLNMDLNLPPNSVKLATGFGEGIGRYGKNCGALSGAVMSLNIFFGLDNPSVVSLRERVKENGCYKVFNELIHEFEKQFGSTLCEEIVDQFDEIYNREHLWYCMDLTAKTASIVFKLFFEVNESGIENLDFNKNIGEVFKD